MTEYTEWKQPEIVNISDVIGEYTRFGKGLEEGDWVVSWDLQMLAQNQIGNLGGTALGLRFVTVEDYHGPGYVTGNTITQARLRIRQFENMLSGTVVVRGPCTFYAGKGMSGTGNSQAGFAVGLQVRARRAMALGYVPTLTKESIQQWVATGGIATGANTEITVTTLIFDVSLNLLTMPLWSWNRLLVLVRYDAASPAAADRYMVQIQWPTGLLLLGVVNPNEPILPFHMVGDHYVRRPIIRITNLGPTPILDVQVNLWAEAS